MDQISYGQYSLVYNALSFVLAAMGAATVFLFLSRSQVSPKYRTAVTVSGIVTFIAAYHYFRIFTSWDAAYSVVNGVVTATGRPFNDAYRYMDWLLTVPLLVTELILVMRLPGNEGSTKASRLALLAVAMVLLGYPGEISHVASTRWMWWCLSMIPFLVIQYELFVGLKASIAAQPPKARGLVSAALHHGCHLALLPGRLCAAHDRVDGRLGRGRRTGRLQHRRCSGQGRIRHLYLHDCRAQVRAGGRSGGGGTSCAEISGCALANLHLIT